MPHKRSPKAAARRYVGRFGYVDRWKSEAVNQVARDEVRRFLEYHYEDFSMSDIPEVVRGEVLKDSRGEGYFQRTD